MMLVNNQISCCQNGPLCNELLSQQMEQLLKLEDNLKQEKSHVDLLNEEVYNLKQELERKSLMLEVRTKAKTTALNTDIRNLQFECEQMKDKITRFKKKSGYKSPENSITNPKKQLVPEITQNNESSQSLTFHQDEKATETTPVITASAEGAVGSQQEQLPEPLDWEEVESEEKWSCSQCTFLNHPCLDTCEICSMPRIKFAQGMSSSPELSTNHHQCSVHKHQKSQSSSTRSKIFSLPKLRRKGENPAAKRNN